MKCVRCNSTRIMRFIDGFGDRRVFCRSCWGSWLEESVIEFGDQRKLSDFKIFYNNNRAIRHFRW